MNVLVLDYRNGLKYERPMTPEELAQREADRLVAEEEERRRRAVIPTSEFVRRFQAIGKYIAVITSEDPAVKALVFETLAHPTVNLLDEEKVIPSVRVILQAEKGILTEAQADTILEIPPAR